MTQEPNSADDLERAVGEGTNGLKPDDLTGADSAAAGGGPGASSTDTGVAGNMDPLPPEAADPAEPASETLLTEMAVTIRDIAAASDRYHARAEQREAVIDYLRTELDLLRRGERRGLLRPVLAELCRLRDDLLRQAATLPPGFSPDKAADLLRSYAETIELTLENNGVVSYAPDSGDPFNPRLHRRVTGEPTADPAQAGQVAAVKRDGYLDIEANSPIAPAEVSVYAVAQREQEQ